MNGTIPIGPPATEPKRSARSKKKFPPGRPADDQPRRVHKYIDRVGVALEAAGEDPALPGHRHAKTPATQAAAELDGLSLYSSSPRM